MLVFLGRLRGSKERGGEARVRNDAGAESGRGRVGDVSVGEDGIMCGDMVSSALVMEVLVTSVGDNCGCGDVSMCGDMVCAVTEVMVTSCTCDGHQWLNLS